MKSIIKALSLILTLIMLVPAAGCKENYQEAVIYFELPGSPQTLDPQIAESDAELCTVRNIYEGLLRRNSAGAIVCGAAESFKKEGLVYTFKIRKDAQWSNKTPLTANDFVFALKRAVSPQTRAPFASRLYCIENAEAINKGGKSADTLGVSAPDSQTLIIKTVKDDEDFEQTLTTPIAMPCNEEFFNECEGKYGLSSEYVISCGSYRITRWDREADSIKMYANAFYNGTFTAKNAAVFMTLNKEETAFERLIKNSVDISFIDSSLTAAPEFSSFKTAVFENICWVMTVNSDFSADMRKAFAMLTDGKVYSDDLPGGYKAANSIYPSGLNINPTSSGITVYNLEEAKRLFAKETAALPDGKFPETRLYYYDNGVIKPIITDIAGHWQNNLGAFVNIEARDSAEALMNELKNQTLSMAVFPVRADSPDVYEYLNNFGYTNKSASPEKAQVDILKNNSIIPIAFQSTVIAYSDALNDVCTELGNGYIDFSFIVKVE